MQRAFPIGVCLALVGVLPGFGQESARERQLRTTSRPLIEQVKPAPAPVRRVSDLLGSSISVRGGGALGTVSDVLFNDNGSIHSVVIRTSDGHTAVPWRDVSYNGLGRLVVTRAPAPAERPGTEIAPRPVATLYREPPGARLETTPRPWEVSPGGLPAARLGYLPWPSSRPSDVLAARREEREAPRSLPPSPALPRWARSTALGGTMGSVGWSHP
jgi:hypothetical protein